MPDQDDENRDRCSDSGPVAPGGSRKTNLTERARKSLGKDVFRKKVPPEHGPLPPGGTVDRREILNPDPEQK